MSDQKIQQLIESNRILTEYVIGIRKDLSFLIGATLEKDKQIADNLLKKSSFPLCSHVNCTETAAYKCSICNVPLCGKDAYIYGSTDVHYCKGHMYTGREKTPINP
jgi:hypothetical protein